MVELVEATFQRARLSGVPLVLVSLTLARFGTIEADEADCFSFKAVQGRSTVYHLCRDTRLERQHMGSMILRESGRPLGTNRVLLRVSPANNRIRCGGPNVGDSSLQVIVVITWVALESARPEAHTTLVVVARREANQRCAAAQLQRACAYDGIFADLDGNNDSSGDEETIS